MNSLVLLVVAAIVFIMGYRFYAKFLTLGIFRIDHDATPPSVHRSDGHDFTPCPRWILLGHHIAATAGVATLIGVGVAAVWGWLPAFLWITVGTVVAGGTYVLGTLWASLRKSGESLSSVAYEMTGFAGAIPLFFLGLWLLVLLAAILCLALGQLLHHHPEATWSFLLFMPITIVARQVLNDRDLARQMSWAAAAVLLFVIGLALGQWFPLGLSGYWSVNLSGQDVLSLRHELVWAALALIPAYLAAKAPVWHTNRPRGVFVALLLALLVAAVLLGIFINLPDLAAPQFQRNVSLPQAPMLLLIVVSGGALAGFTALIASGTTVRQVERQRDAPVLGYGGVVADGVLALLALIAVTAGFAALQDWEATYTKWPEHTNLYVWLDLVITKFAGFIAAFGVPIGVAVGFVAAVCAGLALTTLENALRALSFAIGEFTEDFDLPTLGIAFFRERVAAVVTALVVLWLSQAELGLEQWLAFGISNQWFACCVLLLLALALMRLGRAVVFFLIPFALIATLTLWGTVWALLRWLEQENWQLLGVGLAVMLLTLWIMVVYGLELLRTYRLRQASLPVEPPSI